MESLFHPKIATRQIWKGSLVITIIMIIWHFTLLRSHTPHMNSIFSWVTTVVCPALTLIGIRIIVKAYSKSGNVAGEAVEGVSWGFLFDFEGAIGAIAFIALLPVIGFLIPAEVALGIAYKKGWMDLVIDVWDMATFKESIFIITKGFFVVFSGSFLVWEILLQVWFLIKRIFGIVMR